jgi:hypothetical protein
LHFEANFVILVFRKGGLRKLPRAYRTDRGKYDVVIKEAKKNYFLELLTPYVKDGILDTKTLHKSNGKLYEEFRLSFKGIRTGCYILGIHPSAAALRAKVGPMRKQIRTLALAYLEENGLDTAAGKLGVGVDAVQKIQDNLTNPQAVPGRKKGSGRKKK